MPKQTFQDLPLEKKERIQSVAEEEFYQYGYQKASISRIVQNAGIAKGSFYQYFEDKADLFRMILQEAFLRKRDHLEKVRCARSGEDFFALLEALYRGALSFLQAEPRLAAISDRFMQQGDETLKASILGDGVQKSNQFLKELLQQAVELGSIRPDIDLDFTAHLLTSLSMSLGDYVRQQAGEEGKTVELVFFKRSEELVRLLREGIGQ